MNHIPAIIRTVFLGALAGFLCVPANAAEQITTIIGGSGKPRVEVNLDAINPGQTKSSQHRLRYPGVSRQKTVTLRPPAKLKDSGDIPRRDTRQANVRRSILLKPSPQPNAPNARSVTVQPLTAPVKIVSKLGDGAGDQSTVSAPASKLALAKSNPVGNQSIERKSSSNSQGTASDPVRLIFSPSRTKLDSSKETSLIALARTAGNGQHRIQIKAFASTAPDQHPSHARRLSLSRALAVRSHLIKQGVPSTIIDVRALGEPKDGMPADRVDVLLLPQ